ncbi:OmpA family protein [Dysgonomonas sp. 25]|uniref:PorE family type IX secretion system protein n=1 Tax=Dysgonomonas sp. 25 TaxID=2302933 RepID=UPI001629144C|nr:OmpA family protein [Dysgonomonas sp. 25]
MKKYNYILLVLLLVIGGSCRNAQLKKADEKFAKGEYYDAAELYRKVYRKIPPKERDLRGEVAFKTAESFRLINMPIQANSAYANAVRYKADDNTLPLQYARTLHKTGNYKKAAEMYELFLETSPDNRFARSGLHGTELAQQWKAAPTAYTIKKMNLFMSTRGGEFAPMLLPPDYDQVFFSSSRKESKGDNPSEITGVKNNDIYFSRKDDNGEWMAPEHLESPVNTDFDEGVTSFNAGGTTMYYTYSPQDSVNSSYSSIYISQRAGGSWGAPKQLKLSRDTMAVYAHPSLTPSGEFLYFVSDLPKGYGGKDIWRANMVGDEINYIENLGPEINTAGDEMFPYMRDDTTLYFSSDGHPGMGGLDIFKAVYNQHSGRWEIGNMKYPINSEGDDFGITFEGERERGFFSSNRGEGRGWDRIYRFEYPEENIRIEGYIVDPDDEFVTNATIRMVGNNGTNKKIDGRQNGTYNSSGDIGVNYVFLASAQGYLNARMALNTLPNVADSTYFVDFVMTPINKPVVLENIFFDFDRATLRPESKDGLNELIELLKLNPNVTIELSAHTDRHGSDEYNDNLSQRRAESVVDYLIEGGIAKDRLVAKGYGKREPKKVTKAVIKKYKLFNEGDVLTDAYIEQLPPEEQEIADEINRRTQFRVLSITYNME